MADKIRVSGVEYELAFDITTLLGDALEELENHLGDEGVIAWMARMAEAFEHGMRVREMRVRDIIALVFLARAPQEPGLRWQDVSRTIAPFSIETIEDQPAVAGGGDGGPRRASPTRRQAKPRKR